MRVGMVVVGVVLLVIGAVLLFVPVAPQPSQTMNESSIETPYAFQISGFSITGNMPITVSWTSNTSVTLLAVACTGSCNSGNISTLSGVEVQTGTSGTFNMNVPSGGTVEIGAAPLTGGPSTTTVNVTTSETTIGSILLIVGILLLIVGLVLKRKSKAMSAPPAMPAQESQPPMAPPAQ
jgi:uncharacterized membrane protein